MNGNKKIYTVSEITQIIKEIITQLGSIWIEGEISNFKRASSGHCYFTLKDESSQIQCALFSGEARKIRIKPKDGQKVILYGDLGVYETRGQHQIIVRYMENLGTGQLQLEFEKLKNRLSQEGLFDKVHKKEIPIFPEKIAVVTSPTGAAIRDIIDVISRRYPYVDITVFPVLVQGEKAAEQIANAIKIANQFEEFDIMIISRGGGSMEDLWAFNEEIVVRSIFASEIPVISAVGHEIDFTLSDFVADLRAPTPSAAAEIAVPDKAEIKIRFDQYSRRLSSLMNDKIERERKRLENIQKSLQIERRLDEIRQFQQITDQLTEQLRKSMVYAIENKKQQFKLFVEKLNQLSPLSTLSRGYSICYDKEQNIIKSLSQVQTGDEINVRLADGEIVCKVLRY